MTVIEQVEARKYRILRDRLRKTNHLVCYMIVLIVGLYNSLCVIFWMAVAGIPNAIDNSPGLPLYMDYIMAGSMLLVSLSGIICIRIVRSWMPRIKKKEIRKSVWETNPDDSLDIVQSVRSTKQSS